MLYRICMAGSYSCSCSLCWYRCRNLWISCDVCLICSRSGTNYSDSQVDSQKIETVFYHKRWNVSSTEFEREISNSVLFLWQIVKPSAMSLNNTLHMESYIQGTCEVDDSVYQTLPVCMIIFWAFIHLINYIMQ